MKVSSLNEIGPVRDYLARIGAEPRSLKTAVVRETRGTYWEDIAVIRFGKDGEVSSSALETAPTEGEQAAIANAWASVEFPRPKRLSRIINAPEMIANAAPKDLFQFWDEKGKEIIMIQVRIARRGPDGEAQKSYVPWTYWDDEKWRMCEPDGDLPLWGLEQLQHHKTAFIHEGAKAAARCAWMAEGLTRDAQDALAAHPWGRELAGAAHLGWIGGAMNPNRTDWKALARAGIERVYIVGDNDEPGKSAISSISQHIKMPTFSIEFNGRFPVSFDLADPFPDAMFKQIGAEMFYTGPSMRDLTQPATWATDLMPNPAGKGRPITVLRDSFRSMWAYVEEADAYVCTEMPEIVRSEAVFNKMVAGFSHVNETSKLLNKAYKGRSARICYRPDTKARLVDDRGTNAINLHVPTTVRPAEGDPTPFLEFLEYMFVHEEERKEVERWCATLIARPEIRMNYGLLLVSETQGVGKTTLGSSILAPLVGQQNVGYPNESDITSQFNGWVAQKRLAIVNEIYSGASWRAYHALKSVITDHDVTVNEKYMRQYTVDNWVHIFACSNSMRALKMDHDDRRWLYPQVTEVPWGRDKFTALRHWINGGGLQIILRWALDYGDYVGPADRAPMTDRKRELIEGSRSEAQSEAAAVSEMLKDDEKPGALLVKDVMGWLRNSVHGKVFETDYEIRKTMVEVGLRAWDKRLKVNGRLQHAVLNDALFDLCSRSDEPMKVIRDHIRKPDGYFESEM